MLFKKLNNISLEGRFAVIYSKKPQEKLRLCVPSRLHTNFGGVDICCVGNIYTKMRRETVIARAQLHLHLQDRSVF